VTSHPDRFPSNESSLAGPRGRARDLARLPITLDLRRLSIAEGVRAALSVAVIMAASAVVDIPSLREAALAALLTCLCDPGGPVRRRVPVLLGFSLAGAAITAGFGLVRGLGMPVALPLGIFALFCASFVRVYGQIPQQLGVLLGVVIVLSLDRALADVATAGMLAGAFLAGGLWATLLTLVIWRLHPYLPARRAVAEIYGTLALLVADLIALLRVGTRDDAAWEAHARAHRRAVREAIETARAIVFDTVRARGASSNRATQSLIRLEAADQIFATLIALSELLEHADTAQRDIAKRLLRRLRPLLVVLGRVIVTDNQTTAARTEHAIDALAAEHATLTPGNALRGIIDRIVDRLRITQTLAVPANFAPGADAAGQHTPIGVRLRERLIEPALTNLDWRSHALRHALRIALMAAPALAFTMLWFTPYDHWLTITIVATMQPHFALTYARAIERVLGTMLGGMVAALVGLVCATPLAIAAAMFPLSVAALAVRGVSLGLFMIVVTPLVVLLVEVGEPDTSEWRIAAARAGFTLLGGALAMAACFLLWPTREQERLMQEARGAIGAHGRYAETALAHLLNGGPASAVDTARREAGLASNSLEASINRALNEPGAAGRRRLEAVLVIDAALRRLAGRLSAMHLDPAQVAAPVLLAWHDWIGGSMRALAAGNVSISERPALPAGDAVARIARQIELMAGALSHAARSDRTLPNDALARVTG
jgi:uncharacterized membrane protein YccC